jgi:hypothetical protein
VSGLLAEIFDPGPPTCPRTRVNTVDAPIVGLSGQKVPYVCGQVATVQLENEIVCEDCWQNDLAKEDASRLLEWAHTVAGWSDAMAHRTEIGQWLYTVAQSMIQMHVDLEKGAEQS